MDKKVEVKDKLSIYDDRVFKMCVAKCCSRDHTNFAGETIHHTVYQCLEHCGFKWQQIKASTDL